MAGFAVVAVGCGVFTAHEVALADPPAPPVIARAVTARGGGLPTITFAGDTMLGDAAAELFTKSGPDYLLSGVAPLLGDADVTVVNAEGPLTTQATPNNPGAKYSYAVPPAAAAALARAGVDVLSLGNNHAMDRGASGLADTVTAAQAAGLSVFGAGANAELAARPLILKTATDTVALVGFGEDFGPLQRSGPATAGMVPMKPAALEAGMNAAERAGATKVVAVVHWGDNYEEVNDQQRYWAAQFVAAGYSAVIGSGSHTVQPAALVEGVPVVYSVGNLEFGTPGRYADYGKQGVGTVATLDLGARTLTFRCVRTDNEVVQFVARECDATELGLAVNALGPAVTWTGQSGVLHF